MALLHRPSTTYGQWMNSLQQSSDILVLLLSYPYIIIIVICLYYNSYMVVIFLIYFCHINIVSLSYIIAIPVTDLSYFFQMFVICLSYACHILPIYGCADGQGPASRRGSHVYEINDWLWNFGRPQPRVEGLSVARTERISRKSRSETSRRAWETRKARKMAAEDI